MLVYGDLNQEDIVFPTSKPFPIDIRKLSFRGLQQVIRWHCYPPTTSTLETGSECHLLPHIPSLPDTIMVLLSLNGFFRFASAVVGFMLFIVACAGFNTLKLSVSSVDIQAQFGCLCFLGVCFGLLLTFGESKWELFFFFFGFMRYRLGRACIFAVSGIMTAILGKTRNQQCDCNDNVIIIIEGVALVAMAILQTLAILIFGNNSAPRCNTETVRLPAAIQLAVTAPPQVKEAAPFHAIVQPISKESLQAPAPVAHQTSPTARGDSNLPSWMHTP
ncbi:hypothetical protein PI124_g20087 [Phytophthora idaei]|nr:hypothetical protein PI125_g21144 [Phytophthora idaei]KAG3132880.1 hypothetical protein PI126_g19436 [Phytophthora idaei]KAG3234866.1 hypothetical protein PI124_g20087 [Phytophthora idaei]